MNLLEKSCFFCTIILNRFLDIFEYFEIEKLKYKYRNNGTMEKYFVFEFYSKKKKKTNIRSISNILSLIQIDRMIN